MTQLGVRYNTGTVSVGDTAELFTAVQEKGRQLGEEDLVSVEFTVQKPNLEVLGPYIGEILPDGRGYYRWTDTEEPGEYWGQARFALASGELTSRNVNFTVADPFDNSPRTFEDIVIDDVWVHLEDCFDSLDGGPWLAARTRGHFDKNKIAHFIPETLLEINVQMPPSHMAIAEFAKPNDAGEQNELLPLLSRGVLCRVAMHLIRSYIEQPVPQGAQVTYEDRTRYKDAWKQAYELEHAEWIAQVRLWKRQMLHLGRSKLLIGSKAGRLYYGQGMRTRNVGRGFI